MDMDMEMDLSATYSRQKSKGLPFLDSPVFSPRDRDKRLASSQLTSHMISPRAKRSPASPKFKFDLFMEEAKPALAQKSPKKSTKHSHLTLVVPVLSEEDEEAHEQVLKELSSELPSEHTLEATQSPSSLERTQGESTRVSPRHQKAITTSLSPKASAQRKHARSAVTTHVQVANVNAFQELQNALRAKDVELNQAIQYGKDLCSRIEDINAVMEEYKEELAELMIGRLAISDNLGKEEKRLEHEIQVAYHYKKCYSERVEEIERLRNEITQFHSARTTLETEQLHHVTQQYEAQQRKINAILKQKLADWVKPQDDTLRQTFLNKWIAWAHPRVVQRLNKEKEDCEAIIHELRNEVFSFKHSAGKLTKRIKAFMNAYSSCEDEEYDTFSLSGQSTFAVFQNVLGALDRMHQSGNAKLLSLEDQFEYWNSRREIKTRYSQEETEVILDALHSALFDTTKEIKNQLYNDSIRALEKMNLDDILMSTNEETDALENKVNLTTENVGQLEIKVHETESEISGLEKSLDMILEQMLEACTRKEILHNSVSEANEKLLHSTEALEKLTAEQDEETLLHESLETELRESNGELDKCREEFSVLKGELDVLVKTQEELQNEISRLQLVEQSQETELSCVTKERDELLQEIEKVEEDVKIFGERKSQLEEETQQTMALREHIKTQVAEQQLKLTGCTEKLNDAEHEQNEHERSIGSLEMKVDERKTHLNELCELDLHQSDKLLSLMETSDLSQKSVRENERSLFEITENQLRVQVEYEWMEQVKAIHTTFVSETEHILSHIRTSVESLSAQYDISQKRLNSLSAFRHALENQRDRLENEVSGAIEMCKPRSLGCIRFDGDGDCAWLLQSECVLTEEEMSSNQLEAIQAEKRLQELAAHVLFLEEDNKGKVNELLVAKKEVEDLKREFVNEIQSLQLKQRSFANDHSAIEAQNKEILISQQRQQRRYERNVEDKMRLEESIQNTRRKIEELNGHIRSWEDNQGTLDDDDTHNSTMQMLKKKFDDMTVLVNRVKLDRDNHNKTHTKLLCFAQENANDAHRKEKELGEKLEKLRNQVTHLSMQTKDDKVRLNNDIMDIEKRIRNLQVRKHNAEMSLTDVQEKESCLRAELTRNQKIVKNLEIELEKALQENALANNEMREQSTAAGLDEKLDDTSTDDVAVIRSQITEFLSEKATLEEEERTLREALKLDDEQKANFKRRIEYLAADLVTQRQRQAQEIQKIRTSHSVILTSMKKDYFGQSPLLSPERQRNY